MYEQLTGRVGVFTGGVNVGIIRTDGDCVILVDTGANESNARKTLRVVREELKAEVDAILTTHGHADHVGGHAFVVKRTGAAVYAPRFEAAVLEHPELQPTLLFGGSAAPQALLERGLLAEPSPVDTVLDVGPVQVGGVPVETIGLGGHSPNQVGYLVEGVFFCADVVFPRSAIEKYRIPYLFDLGAHMASMERARAIEARFVVCGHGPIATGIDDLVEQNRYVAEETLDEIRRSLAQRPLALEETCEVVFERMDVPMRHHVSYYLLRPTIGAYLTWLEHSGEIEHVMEGRVAKWRLR
jgi:glyoxylase-like metal-dependent hydrolase (beta-lactamase superfamily II)